MGKFYSSEKNVQILIALMKAHGIHKVIVSPGTTNLTFVGSLQHDSWFELYSSVDERSAAYIACGLAAESGEPVVLSCTGATAARNYAPGLTEAYYRKLPVLAVTSTQHLGRVGHLIPQVTDRSSPMRDMVKWSVQIPTVHDAEDEWACEVSLNKAILELSHHGGGPVHINLITTYSKDFSIRELPEVRTIHRVLPQDTFPSLKPGRVGIFVGAHTKWDPAIIKLVDKFCATYDAVVLSDHTSNYCGKYRVFSSLVCSQKYYYAPCRRFDILIHLGEVSGSYMNFHIKSVWRVSKDGDVCDTFRKLHYVFEMNEKIFFSKYLEFESNKKINFCQKNKVSFFDEWQTEIANLTSKIPELPFSNAWIAYNTISSLPNFSILHLGILNTLRVWNFFERSDTILAYSNTGGFGIDGIMSTLVGASLSNKDKLFFCIIGDLAFFYDLNVIGNKHIGNNIRILLVNNGRGIEFRNNDHPCNIFGNDADKYMAAAGHFGNKSPNLIKHYAKDLGYEYLTASNKKEYLENIKKFIGISPRSIIFEVFTDMDAERHALEILLTLASPSSEEKSKLMAKRILGERGINAVKKILGPYCLLVAKCFFKRLLGKS